MSTVENAGTAGTDPSRPVAQRMEDHNQAAVPTHAIVVGLDHSPHSAAALEWAAAEAVTRGLPLHLMHMVQPPLWPDAPGLSQFEEKPTACVTRALRALADSCAGLAVTWSQPYGSPLPALTWASRFATLIVVGTRAHGPLRQVVTGSTAVGLIADARCPVVVVRTAPGGKRSGPVVVGLDGGRNDRETLHAAFQEAELFQRALVAVHATDYGFLEHADVERRVAAEQQRHPRIAVKVRFPQGDPTELMVAHSAEASLLVLGSHGRHEAASFVLGSVGQGLLRRAACPVLVARSGTVRLPGAGSGSETVDAEGDRDDG